MSVPQLNRLLVLETPVRVADGAGGFAESWVALGQVWAEVRPGSGREVGGEEVTLSQVALRITVRAAPHGNDRRPRAGQRFRDGGRVFVIIAVTERDGFYLTCFAREEETA